MIKRFAGQVRRRPCRSRMVLDCAEPQALRCITMMFRRVKTLALGSPQPASRQYVGLSLQNL